MLAIFAVFLRLGCSCFGGPAAHLGYFRDEFVRKRAWLSHEQFAQCIALTQLLPGPASSQTGMLIGLLRGGWPGCFAAWLGFTLPSAMLMTAFALYAPAGFEHAPWLRGLLVAAVAVVTQALLIMRRALLKTPVHLLFAFGTMAAVLTIAHPMVTPAAIACCALAGLAFPAERTAQAEILALPVSRRAAAIALVLFGVLLAAIGAFANALHGSMLVLASRLFAVGSLVFGGGHVVLPLLQSQVVKAGIAAPQQLIAGYAAAQALPGPLFTLSSYIGAIAYHGSLGVTGAAVATVAIFAPSFLLIAAVAPFYRSLASSPWFSRALAGANASVVGLLASAFVTPIWTSAVHTVSDGLLAAAAFVALAVLRFPNWLVVLLCAAAGFALYR